MIVAKLVWLAPWISDPVRLVDLFACLLLPPSISLFVASLDSLLKPLSCGIDRGECFPFPKQPFLKLTLFSSSLFFFFLRCGMGEVSDLFDPMLLPCYFWSSNDYDFL